MMNPLLNVAPQTRPLRVLLLTAGFAVEGPLGGIERFGIDLAFALDRQLVTPVICGLWDYGTPFEETWLTRLHAAGIEAFIGAPKDDVAPYRNFMRILAELRSKLPDGVDIVHSHSEFGDVAAVLLQRQFGARAIVRTVHNGGGEWQKSRLRRLALTHGLYPVRFTQEIGVAEHIVARLNTRPLARLLRRKAMVIYNALDFSRFSTRSRDGSRIRQALGISSTARVVGTVGRLAPEKGLPTLLLAAQQVIQRQPETYFLLAGAGPLRGELELMAQQLGIDERVLFLGARADIEEIYASLDLLVSASLWEGLPTAILEAMAAHVPVVATANPGTLEIVRHEQTGILVQPGNPTALGDAILTALDAGDSSLAMVQNASEFVRTRFSIDTIARQHEALYRKLVTSQR